MSQTSRGSSNKGSSAGNNNNKRPNVVHNSHQLLLLQQQQSIHKPIINSRFAPTQANNHTNGSISSQPQQQQQQQQPQPQQLLSTTGNNTNNGPIGSVNNICSISNSNYSNNRLATLANVSVAAAAAANKNRHQQQPQQQQHPNHLSIANAPTSLANLARLGGITLLPISTGGSSNELKGGISSNLAIDLNMYTHHQNQSNGGASVSHNRPAIINDSNTTSKSFIPISRSQEPIMTTSSNNNVRLEKSLPHFANSHWRFQKTSDLLAQHDLEAISSVGLLNQATNIDSASLWLRTGSVGDNAFTGTKNRQQISTAFPASTTTLTAAGSSSANRAIKKTHLNPTSQPVTNNNNMKNNINQAFVPENRFASFLSSMSSYQTPPQPIETSGGLLHNNTSMTSPFDSSSPDQDLNNSSLMKLMAILNNPALTITAVNNTSSNAYGSDSNASSNYNYTTRNNQLDRSNQLSTFSMNLTNKQQAKTSNLQTEPMLGNDQIPSQTQSTSRSSRVPQSATNLQLLFKSSNSQLTNKNQRFSQTTNQANSTNNIINRSNTSLNSSVNPNSNPYQKNWSDKATVDNYNSDQTNSVANQIDIANQPKTFLSVVADNTALHDAGNEIYSRSNQTPTVSVQLLKHIASQARNDDSRWMVEHDPDVVGRAVLEPECIITNARSLLPFSKEAKYVKVNSEVRVNCARKRRSKTTFSTSKKRLFIPNKIDSTTGESDKGQDPLENMHITIINEPGGKELYVSEQHQMLCTMMADRGHSNFKDKANVNGMIPEPDDIFINRPKKVMSKIDTMLERKKRKRFERISGRSAPKTISLEEQCEESDAEWSDNDAEVHEKLSFVTVQLPLDDEELSSAKREHLHSVGLVSRYERQKISLQNLERQMSRITPLAFEGPPEVSEDLKRMVDTVVKTDGRDVQMRIDSNIKRNDLPLIEGLSRNTSKVKMSYMSILGLEKRSKRTTLYKLKNVEGTSYNVPVDKELDLNKRAIYPNMDQRASTYNTYYSQPIQSSLSVSNNSQGQSNERPRSQPSIKQHSQQQQGQHVYLNCRDVVKPSKNEYMKSLGLMAS